ncbi:MAG TPA: ParA family protein [Candidatus Krumholzibacteria bacterium]|nr:ParA family protein [Candidatus Krumholzibacteria bacterium]
MDDIRRSGHPAGHAHIPDVDDFDLAVHRDRTPWDTVTGRVISLVSRKGGVGKTTSAVNLGAALALSGHTVLIIGTDSQCGVCRTLGRTPDELPVSLGDIFSQGATLTDLAQPSPLDGLWFVSPKVLSLADEERLHRDLDQKAGDFVREIDRARNLYDTILIDCPPSLGPATRAALLASDSYLVPVQAEELCRESLASLIDFIDEFRARSEAPGASGPAAARLAGQPLMLEGLFLTMANERTRCGREVAARVADDFGDLLLDVDIPRATRLAEMALRGKPAVIYDRRSAGSRAYFDLADELVRRYCQSREDAALDELCDELDADDDETPLRDDNALSAARSDAGLDRFERFLLDLAGPDEPWGAPGRDDLLAPEMVSLDDLLAEEERGGSYGESWDEGSWSFDGDSIN